MAFRALLIAFLFASCFLSCVSAADSRENEISSADDSRENHISSADDSRENRISSADDSPENEEQDISYFFESTLTLHDFPKSKADYYSGFQYVTAKPFHDVTGEPFDEFTWETLEDYNPRLNFFIHKPHPKTNPMYQITARYTGKSERIQLYLCAKRNKRIWKSAPKDQKYLLVGSTKSIQSNKHCFLFAKAHTLNTNCYLPYSAYNQFHKDLKKTGKAELVHYVRVETDTKYIVFHAVKKSEEYKLRPNPIQRLPPPPPVFEGSSFFRDLYYCESGTESRPSVEPALFDITRNPGQHPLRLLFQKRAGEVLYQVVGHTSLYVPSSFTTIGPLKYQKVKPYEVLLCALKDNKLKYKLATPLHRNKEKSRWHTHCFHLGKLKMDGTNSFVAYGRYKKKEDIPVEEYQMITTKTEGKYQPIYFSLVHRGESSQAARPVKRFHREDVFSQLVVDEWEKEQL